MIDAQVLKHIIKFKLPSSSQGSLRWHKFQLQDLLTMVEKFGMSHFILTLIVDEMTSSRWHVCNDMEHLAK
jgi:hypothetical protein